MQLLALNPAPGVEQLGDLTESSFIRQLSIGSPAICGPVVGAGPELRRVVSRCLAHAIMCRRVHGSPDGVDRPEPLPAGSM